MVNELRAGHAYNNNPIAGPLSGSEIIQSFGITGLAPGLPAGQRDPQDRVSGNGPAGPLASGLAQPRLPQPQQSDPGPDHLAARDAQREGGHGHPARRLGGAQRECQPLREPELQRQATAVPGVAASGHPYADFLLGVPNTAHACVSAGAGIAQPMDVRLLRPGRLEDHGGISPSTSVFATTSIPAGTSRTTGWRCSTSRAGRSRWRTAGSTRCRR